ncbi:MAG: hypothetical protein AMXMBFR47_39250 [Planctomycetota bacterium]
MRRFLLTPMLLTAASAGAQTTWVNPVSGNWSNPANWSPANVPDTAGESAMIGVAGNYAVNWDITAPLGGLSIANSDGTLNFLDNRAMYYSGATLTNNGTFVINPAGVNASTYLRLDTGACTISGNGVLRLNANAANLDTAHLATLNGGFTFTNASGHTIAGTGRIRTALTNEGMLSADAAGAALELTQSGKANTGTMRAVAGGVLRLSATALANSGGQVVADGVGSVVSFEGSSVSGGTIAAANGGIAASGNSTLNGVTIAGPFNLYTNTGTSLTGTDLTNNGTITINPTGANATTYLRLDSPTVAIGGSGTIVLNANAANLDTAHFATLNGGYTLTFGPEQTVRGTGRIRTRATNEGTIQADVNGAVLELTDQPKTNNSLIRAINGGVLQVSSIGVTNTNGEIRAESGSTVNLVSAGVTGGTLNGAGGGLIAAANSSFSGVTLEGALQVNPNSAAYMTGNVTNNGDFTINPTGVNANTYMRLDTSSATLDGTGTLHLNANAANLDTSHLATLNGGYALTLGADQTVDGTGRIRVRLINQGTIDANVSGRALEINEHPKTNNGLMRASGGGTLSFSSVSVTNNAQIESEGAGSVVNLANTSLSGGELAAINGGSNAVQNSTFDDVTISGPLVVSAASTLDVTTGGLTDNGAITLNPSGANAITNMRLVSPTATIGGNGAIHLNANAANLDTAHLATLNGGYLLTNAAGHTIDGTGRIRVQMLNNGLVEANISGATLEVHEHLKQNRSIMRARSGGILSFSAVSVDNAGGQIIADGASSVIGFNSMSLGGGRISTTNGGESSISNSTFDDVTLSGTHYLNAATALYLNAGGITNNGVLTINPTGVNAVTHFRLNVPAATIDGNGEIALNANAANLDTAHLATLNGGYQLALGPAQTLSGNGRVRVQTLNHGRLSPGSQAIRIGTIDMQGTTWSQMPDSQFTVDLGGASEFDRITGNATVNLDGVLLVGLVNAYTPPSGSEFQIISCGSLNGEFSDIIAPALGGDSRWRVRYEANRATLVVTCRFDIDADLQVGLQDLAILLSNFGVQSGANERDGDIDSDGDVDLQDLAELLSRFGLACN